MRSFVPTVCQCVKNRSKFSSVGLNYSSFSWVQMFNYDFSIHVYRKAFGVNYSFLEQLNLSRVLGSSWKCLKFFRALLTKAAVGRLINELSVLFEVAETFFWINSYYSKYFYSRLQRLHYSIFRGFPTDCFKWFLNIQKQN